MNGTVTVELRNSNALRLLRDLELANIIRVVHKDKKRGIPKLSKSIRGAITKERAKELNEQLEKMRNEWDDKII